MRRVAVFAEAMLGCVLDEDGVAGSRMRLRCVTYSSIITLGQIRIYLKHICYKRDVCKEGK